MNFKYTVSEDSFWSARDVFKGSFDTTWLDMNQYPSGSIKKFSKLPIENAEDDGLVEYIYNNDGFRCDDFASQHDGKRHVLFAGCSQTEGVGGQLETTWSWLLSKLIKADGFYSLARAGYGWQKIISSFMIYTSKYGFPEYLFVLLPNINRKYAWDTANDSWKYIQKHPYSQELYSGKYRNDRPEGLATEEEHRVSLVDFSVSWSLFLEYCKVNGVKVVWSTWDYLENENIIRSGVTDGFFPMSDTELFKYIQGASQDGKISPFDLKRRDGHDGALIHKYWYNGFRNKIESLGWFND